ncbi:MAG: ABC transporter permease [Candidatus Falkowbacteria bacterium]
MDLFSIIKLVIKNLLARKGRTLLTILGITIGVAGVIIIISLGAGAQSLILGQVTKLGSNLLYIQPGKTADNGAPIPGLVITSLVNSDVEALRDKSRVPHALAVNAATQGTATVTWENKTVDSTFMGTDTDYPKVANFTMSSGQFFSEAENVGGANVVVLGSEISKQLFGDSGVDPIGQVIKVRSSIQDTAGGVPLRVIGVIASRGSSFFQNQDELIFMPLVIGQQQILGIHHLQSIYIKVDNSSNISSTIAAINTVLKQQHHILDDINVDFTIRNQEDAVKILSTITNALSLFLIAMAAISLVVGGIGILNIMMVTVAERTREIGLRKAVGATRKAIRNQFLLESSLLTGLGGLVGIIIGILVSFLISLLMKKLGYDWAFVVSWVSIVLSVGVSVLTGVVFGLFPAIKAAKLDPIDALRYE